MSNLELVLLIWLFLLGGCFGSFMNVVIYRLPAGKSLLNPGSRCPLCEKPIRPYHNLPVIGWLLLRGKCYDCGAPISIRYPMVEAVVAVAFLLLAVAIFRPGTTESVPSIASLRLWGLYGCSALFGCVVFCMAAIIYDRQRIPRSLYLLAGVAVVGGLLCVSVLR